MESLPEEWINVMGNRLLSRRFLICSENLRTQNGFSEKSSC